MRTFGLTGYPLGHSFSAKWFAEKFVAEGIADAQYLNFPIEHASMLPELLGRTDILGLNVTTPCKESVIEFLDCLSPEAAAIGAVNCVVRRGGRLTGYNTDWMAFRQSLAGFLNENGADATTLEALILGSGGAAKAAAYALRDMGVEYGVVSRGVAVEHDGQSVDKSCVWNGNRLSYSMLGPEIINSHRLIINATPVGMFPDTCSMPAIPYELLSERHLLYDMVYNPALTAFLSEGRRRGCRVKNGLEMLHLQAQLSWELFLG